MLDLAQGVTRDPHLLSPSGFKTTSRKIRAQENTKILLAGLKTSPARERWDPVPRSDFPPYVEGETSLSDGVWVCVQESKSLQGNQLVVSLISDRIAVEVCMFIGYLLITMFVVFLYMFVRIIALCIYGSRIVTVGSGQAFDDAHNSFVNETHPADNMYWGEAFMGDTLGSISTSGDPF